MNIKNFKNPDNVFRPVPLWSWNESLDKEEIRRQINEMKEKGWGGYVCHSRVGLVTGYLSDEWMDMIKISAIEARKTGTYALLYDEDKWPSGYAGGVVALDENNRDRCIMMVKKNDIKTDDTVLKEFSYNSQEYIISKHVMPVGDEWFNGTTYVDLMNPNTVKKFLESTHEKYKEACSQYFGMEIPGIFTDEPCYFMDKYYKDNHFIFMSALPWSEYLPAYFEKLKGYSVFEHLEELFLNINDYRKTRFDFYDAATKLFVKSFTKQYYEWCDKNNIKLTGHFMGEDTMMLQTEYIGAAMPHYEYMQWPGIDKLSRHINELVTVKQLTSVTDQLGKERAFCESFGCIGQHTSFFHRKWIADWMAVLGINFVNHHLALYSMRGERKRDYPPNFFYQQPWWDCEKPFSDYLSRLSYAVTQGKLDVDILIIHPISSAWCDYTPLEELKNTLSPIKNLDAMFSSLSNCLFQNKLDFHYGDEIIMEKHAKIENGRLVIGKHSYSTVIVPSCITLRENTFKILENFAGASKENSLVLVSPLTERLDGVHCSIQWPKMVEIVDSDQAVLRIVNRKYQDRISIKKSVDGSNADKILLQERTSEIGKQVLIVNTDEKSDIEVLISVQSEYSPVALDLSTGDAVGIPFIEENGRIIIKATFKPAGSLLLYFSDKSIETEKTPAILDSGLEFKTKFQTTKTIESCGYIINESNVLKLDHLTLTMNGQEVLTNEIVPKAWYDIFYKAPEGTPFTVQYGFNVTNVPKGDLFAVIEMAENLDSISLNGFKLESLKHQGDPLRFEEAKNWKDLSFTKVPFKASILREGLNVLIIQGKKVNNTTGQGTHRHVENFKEHQPTEVENVYIVGDFIVKDEDRKSFYLSGEKQLANTKDITSTGYPFYAGNISVEFNIGLEENNVAHFIKINDVNAACVEVYVNGKYTGVKYWSPYIYDIGEFLIEGNNTISVKAYTTLFNLMGPNYISDVLQRPGVGPYTFVDFKKYTESYVLLPFGIGDIDVME